ncbi:MAG TPA: DUF1016 N-terminal domain-containing protein, partial [Saprospiraceae bacterium]|nr:DUF1016 N-terminal domain-containing protein [Saprospiraceae bacterium]
MTPEHNIEPLIEQISALISGGRQQAYRAVNAAMTATYWEIGRLIVEEEQQGRERAEYGAYLIRLLSKRLRKEFGSGCSEQSLWNYRQFYLQFPILSAVRRELTWTHYRLLMRVENTSARAFYEEEAVRGAWSTRALERQIGTFYYERLLAGGDRTGMENEAKEKTAALPASPRDFVKDPYVLEFLDIKPDHSLYERDLEQLLMDNLQTFL